MISFCIFVSERGCSLIILTQKTKSIMKTRKLKRAGFTEAGILNFIRVVESTLPHLPGNWDFIDSEKKLSFISKNKEMISKSIQAAMPGFSEEENEAFAWFNTTDPAKIKRLDELQSASQALAILVN